MILLRIWEWLRKLMGEILEKPVKDNQFLAIYSCQLETVADGLTPGVGTSITQSDYVDTGLTGGAYIMLTMSHFGSFDADEPWYGEANPYTQGYGSGGDGGRVGYWLSYYTEEVNGQLRVVYEYTRWSPNTGISSTTFEGTVIKLRGN